MINGKAAVNVVGLTNGTFTATVIYQGDDSYNNVSTGSTIKVNPAEPVFPARLGSILNVRNYMKVETYAVDFSAGEKGLVLKAKLTDTNGKPIVNQNVTIAYRDVILVRPTDENGVVQFQINKKTSDAYFCAYSYLGDETHNATFAAINIIVNKKPITITASAKTYKVSAKTKKYTVTLKTKVCNSRDGKVYLNAGKKVTMKINGKTYTAKTNAKGQATFKIKINKKGKFAAKIKFAGDKTYASANKSVKITIK